MPKNEVKKKKSERKCTEDQLNCFRILLKIDKLAQVLNLNLKEMMRKSIQTVQRRKITGYAYKIAKGMMPKISGKVREIV
jgi:hypothetical protein